MSAFLVQHVMSCIIQKMSRPHTVHFSIRFLAINQSFPADHTSFSEVTTLLTNCRSTLSSGYKVQSTALSWIYNSCQISEVVNCVATVRKGIKNNSLGLLAHFPLLKTLTSREGVNIYCRAESQESSKHSNFSFKTLLNIFFLPFGRARGLSSLIQRDMLHPLS